MQWHCSGISITWWYQIHVKDESCSILFEETLGTLAVWGELHLLCPVLRQAFRKVETQVEMQSLC